MSFRSGLLVAALCAGCATAGHPNQQPPADAAAQVDSPTRRPDAPTMPDAPTTPDAPPPDGSVLPPDGSTGSCSYSGVLATWSFSGQTGSEASVTGTGMASVTAGALSRASGLTAASGSGSINSSNWPTSATLDTTKYYTLTLAPPSGCALALTSMSVTTQASGTGPASAKVGTSADNFAQTSTVSINSQSSPTLSVSGATGQVELRIYGYAATSTSGTLRLTTTLTVSGSLN